MAGSKPPEEVSPWQAGVTIGRFMLLVPLARGGMAEIWLARQSGARGFEKLVVIKRMMSSLAGNSEYLDMFFTEARLAAALNHHNVVQIYDLGEHDGQPYIVMEYLDGEDLGMVRRSAQKLGKPMPDAYAVKYVSLAAEGLHYAHTRVGHDGRPLHIVHRDVSPQNLVATMDGGLKLVDFGIARLASTATFSGKLKGKLAYMSPEQARGEELDARSDVFALGVVLFELLTRTRLTPKMNDLKLLDLMAGDEPFDAPSTRRADISPDLETIIVRALARDRAERFQSARELQDVLEAWLVSQQYAVTANDLRDWLRDIFAARIVERRKLIDTALHMDVISPTDAHNLAKLAQAGESSGSSTRGSRVKRVKRAPWLVAAAALVILGLGAAVVWPKLSSAGAAQQNEARPVLPVGPAVLEVNTVPAGAEVKVNGKALGVAPVTLEDAGDGLLEVEAVLEGYLPGRRTVQPGLPGQRTIIEIALAPRPKVVPPVKEPVAVASPPSPPPKKKPAPVPSGKLKLKTSPWTQVFFNGKKLGDTPLVNVSLPAGKQILKLVAPDIGKEFTIEVDIRPNETTMKTLKL